MKACLYSILVCLEGLHKDQGRLLFLPLWNLLEAFEAFWEAILTLVFDSAERVMVLLWYPANFVLFWRSLVTPEASSESLLVGHFDCQMSQFPS